MVETVRKAEVKVYRLLLLGILLYPIIYISI